MRHSRLRWLLDHPLAGALTPPPSSRGDSAFEVHSRVWIYWNGGDQEILSTGDNTVPLPEKSWVRIRCNAGRTFGEVTNYTSCPYLSPYKNLALMPRSLAEAHFATKIAVNTPVVEVQDDGDLEPVID